MVESARRLGVEIDEPEALAWLSAMAAGPSGGDVTLDTTTGVYGHRVSMLDFSPEELERFREVGRIVEIPDRPGVVESALALSGSAAQSRIQTHPGDCDFFERVNIMAPTREEACRVLADLMRGKALATLSGPTHRLIEVKFGSYPEAVVRDGGRIPAGAPIAWRPEEVEAGRIAALREDGTPVEIGWDDVAGDPGWCKLDWVVADPIRRRLANASNMLDVTWEGPDGEIVPLDGWLDAYYQEVYLDAASIPIFSKLARHMLPDALDRYVTELEHEVAKYCSRAPNYGKAAKRMYNLFRLTGRYREAAFIRELFDEPASVLYQLAALIRTVEEASGTGSAIDPGTIRHQMDELILTAIDVLEGDRERDVVARLLRLRAALDAEAGGAEEEVTEAQGAVAALVNEYFLERLEAVPSIRAYIEEIADRAGEG
ncbi:MAG: hypothetical protein HY658_12010 [Actinobacteria bacterium]|nr:hypothetical protein [Actinomycetota bacterium]